MKKSLVLFILFFCFTSMVFGFAKQESLSEMKAIFFPSAVCFFFADGGTMLIDIGQGINPKVLQVINENLVPEEFVFNLFPPFGWKPRVDWLIMTSRSGMWENKILDLVNSYTFGNIYFPRNPETYRTQTDKRVLHMGISKIMLQIALEKNSISSLEDISEIELSQSNSKIKCEKLELENTPLPAMGSQSAICLLFTYKNTKLLIASELTDAQQQYLLNNSSSKIKADLFYFTHGVTPIFYNTVNAKWNIAADEPAKIFKLDGDAIVEVKN